MLSPCCSRADAVTETAEGLRIFKEPQTVSMSASELLSRTSGSYGTLKKPLGSQNISFPSDLVCYLQSQDSNLSKPPLTSLLEDLPRPLEFANAVFKEPTPDATNLWIGDHRSVTSLHRDPYENMYAVLKGSKTFTLYPPVEELCLYGQYPLRPVKPRLEATVLKDLCV